MGYAEILVTGKFLKARSRQGHSFHMNDSWVPIFRSLSYLVQSWEKLQAGTNTQTYIQANIRKLLTTASRGFSAYLLVCHFIKFRTPSIPKIITGFRIWQMELHGFWSNLALIPRTKSGMGRWRMRVRYSKTNVTPFAIFRIW